VSDDSLWKRPTRRGDEESSIWSVDESARRSLDPRAASEWAPDGASAAPVGPAPVVIPAGLDEPTAPIAISRPDAWPAVGSSVFAADDTPTSELLPIGDPTPVHGAPMPGRAARRRRGWWVWTRRVLLSLLGVLALASAYYGVSLYQVWSVGRHDQARPVDAIVVMGAANYNGRPSPLLQARLDHALELYQSKEAAYIVVTGGKQPSDRYTEAAASRRYLVKHGVPDTAILSEESGHSTWQSLDGVSVLLHKRFAKPRVLIVTDPFHCLRSRLIAQEVRLTAYVSATRTSPWTASTQFHRSVKEAAGIAIGRIIGFHRLWKVTG